MEYQYTKRPICKKQNIHGVYENALCDFVYHFYDTGFILEWDTGKLITYMYQDTVLDYKEREWYLNDIPIEDLTQLSEGDHFQYSTVMDVEHIAMLQGVIMQHVNKEVEIK